MRAEIEDLSKRILVLAPTSENAELAYSVLKEAGFDCAPCSYKDGFCRLLSQGAGAALIPAEALNSARVEEIAGVLESQPPWSDFPFVILTGAGAPADGSLDRAGLVERLGNVTLLERPIGPVTLISAVQSALRSRLRQYEIRKYIENIRAAEAEQSSSLARERSARAETEVFHQVGRILSAELDLDKLVQAVIDAATKLTCAESGAFVYDRVDERGELYTLYASSGIPQEPFANLPAQHVVRLDDIARDPQYAKPHGPRPVVSYLAVPVISRSGAVLGGLCFSHSNPGAFTEREERLAVDLAGQAAIAIDNAALFESTRLERERAEAVRQALERSNDELQQFAYVASHDLQEPLRTVASYTQLLAKRYDSSFDDDAHEFVGYVVGGVNRMSALINDLLEYSRAGKAGEGKPEPASAEAALNEALFALRAAIEEADAEVTHDPLPDIRLHSRQLVQLLQNLIGNALKYRAPLPLKVHVAAEHNGREYVFSVRDNGIGIEPQYHERIFGVFKRLHGKDVPGTGIGLAICKRILEHNGGKIWVESELGKGSAFYFAIPSS